MDNKYDLVIVGGSVPISLPDCFAIGIEKSRILDFVIPPLAETKSGQRLMYYYDA
jgi:hypothetical protein